MYKCENCEQEFEIDYRKIKTIKNDHNPEPRFCSRTCARQYNGKVIKYESGICQKCGNEMQIRKGTNKQYCNKCLNSYKIRASKQQKHLMMNGQYKNQNCINVLKRKKEKKDELVKYKGGKCLLCGYDRLTSALEFHHIDPGTKEFALNLNNLSKSWEDCFAEADKCILVCANCHREIHAGIVQIPIEITE